MDVGGRGSLLRVTTVLKCTSRARPVDRRKARHGTARHGRSERLRAGIKLRCPRGKLREWTVESFRGAGIVQWLQRRTRDRKVAGSSPCSGIILLLRSQFSVLTLHSRYPFHAHVSAAARKRSRSFCQTCRWQVTAKHACTVHNIVMWLRRK